jgi:hypothetical protein
MKIVQLVEALAGAIPAITTPDPTANATNNQIIVESISDGYGHGACYGPPFHGLLQLVEKRPFKDGNEVYLPGGQLGMASQIKRPPFWRPFKYHVKSRRYARRN